MCLAKVNPQKPLFIFGLQFKFFYGIKPCGLICTCQRLQGACCLKKTEGRPSIKALICDYLDEEGSVFVWKVVTYVLAHTISYVRGLEY